MKQTLRLMQAIYASWILGGDAPAIPAIPTDPELFDRGLQRACLAGKFPDWVRDALHFVESSTGLRCLEAPAIQSMATEVRMVDLDPASSKSRFEVSASLAKRLIARLGIRESDASEWGASLRAELLGAA